MRRKSAPGKGDPVIDLGLGTLKVLWGRRKLELDFEPGADGALPRDRKEELQRSVRSFLGLSEGDAASARLRPALCGVSALGVSLRTLELPPVPRDDLPAILRLQLERSFPLPPEEIAFGYYRFAPSQNGVRPLGAGEAGELLVAATRRAAIEEYRDFLAGCGLRAHFALAPLAACETCTFGAHRVFLVDIGRHQTEILALEGRRPRAVRTLPWGGETVTAAIAAALGVERERAEELKTNDPANPDVAGAIESSTREFARRLADVLAVLSRDSGATESSASVVLLGGGSRLGGLASTLEQTLSVTVERAPVPGDGISSVLAGLRRQLEPTGRASELRFEIAERSEAERPQTKRSSIAVWAVAALLLGAASLALRFIPAALERPELQAEITTLEERVSRQPSVDAELGFLQSLESRRAPYLQTLAAIASAAPKGSFFTEIDLTRAGTVSFRGTVKNTAELHAFREKLHATGRFERVVVQNQIPKKKKLDVQLYAQVDLDAPPLPEPEDAPDDAKKDGEKKPGEAEKDGGKKKTDEAKPSEAEKDGEKSEKADPAAPPKASGEAISAETSGEKKAAGESAGKADANAAAAAAKAAEAKSAEAVNSSVAPIESLKILDSSSFSTDELRAVETHIEIISAEEGS